MRRRCVAVLVLCGVVALGAQAKPTFEVASIRPNRSGDPSGGTRGLPDRMEATNVPLSVLLMDAYGLAYYQVAGGPNWADSEKFDIRATAGRQVSRTDLRLMMQSLLAERFKLVTHRETREVRAWDLLVAR